MKLANTYQMQQWVSTARHFCWHKIPQSIITITCISMVVLLVMLSREFSFTWLTLAGYELNLKFSLDSLSVVMLFVVGIIGATVYCYASRYLLSDTSRSRFLTQVLITIMAVMFFIISGNLLTAFVGWQLIGLNLYILLNHYHYQSAANRAAKKKFVINRIGDMCFLLAIVVCYQHFGTTDYNVIGKVVGNEGAQTLILGLVFIAIMTKSAQFPFHIWLPDTMQAPTPVSALMHAGVINSGGILLARLSPLFNQTIGIAYVIVVVGIITLIIGSIFKQIQPDVKKQLAYSTMSQMGYMVLQSGLGCFAAAIFHLIAHGFYKAFLFLNAGNALFEKVKQKNTQAIHYKKTFLAALITAIMVTVSQQVIKHQALPVLIWAFIAISVHNFIANLLKGSNQLIFKAILLIGCQLLLIGYLFALTQFELVTGLLEQKNISNTVQYLLIMVLMIFYFASMHLNMSKMHSSRIGQKLYQYFKNKLYIEEFYRKVLLKPIRSSGEKLNRIVFETKFGKVGFLLILLIPIFIIINTNIVGLRSLGFGALLVMSSIIFLLMSNRAQTLKKMMLLLFFSQSFLLLLNIVYIESDLINQTSTLLIPYGSLFAGIWLLMNSGTATPLKKSNQNKLTVWGTYLAVLLFLLIGLPGTFSFPVWFQLIAQFTQTPFLLVCILLSNIMLTVVVLHTLQDYVFNLKKARQLSKTVTPTMHVILTMIIILNLLYANFSSYLAPSLQ